MDDAGDPSDAAKAPPLPPEPKTVLSGRLVDLTHAPGAPSEAPSLDEEPGTVQAVKLVGLLAKDERAKRKETGEGAEPKTTPAGANLAKLVARERRRKVDAEED